MENIQKQVSVQPEKKDILKRALESSENEKLDLYASIIGGNDDTIGEEGGCSGVVAYSDTVYVRG